MKAKIAFSLLTAAGFALSNTAFAGPMKTYQVTGPILEMNDSMVAVQKGRERWEIARDSATKGNKALKAGDKVTVTYRMTATQIDGKPGKADSKAAAAPAAGAEASPTPRPAGSPKRDF